MSEGRGIPLDDVISRGVVLSGDVEDPHMRRFDVHLDGPTKTDERAHACSKTSQGDSASGLMNTSNIHVVTAIGSMV